MRGLWPYYSLQSRILYGFKHFSRPAAAAAAFFALAVELLGAASVFAVLRLRFAKLHTLKAYKKLYAWCLRPGGANEDRVFHEVSYTAPAPLPQLPVRLPLRGGGARMRVFPADVRRLCRYSTRAAKSGSSRLRFFCRACRVLAAAQEVRPARRRKARLPTTALLVERLLLGGSAGNTLDFDDAHALRYRRAASRGYCLRTRSTGCAKGRALLRWATAGISGTSKKAYSSTCRTVVDAARYPLEGFEKEERSVPVVVWIGSPGTMFILRRSCPCLPGSPKSTRSGCASSERKSKPPASTSNARPGTLRPSFLCSQTATSVSYTVGDRLMTATRGAKPIRMAAGSPINVSSPPPTARSRRRAKLGSWPFRSPVARQLSTLLADEDLRRRMGAAGRARASSRTTRCRRGASATFPCVLESAAGRQASLIARQRRRVRKHSAAHFTAGKTSLLKVRLFAEDTLQVRSRGGVSAACCPGRGR